jgi:Protein of unknown function (DUF1579)
MRRKVLTATVLAAMLLLATRLGTALAQDGFKAGPEHQAMEPLVGTFNAKIKFWQEPGKPPHESDGVMVRKWIMGGRFLQEDFDGSFAGAGFKGLGLMGYDLQKKKYLGTWIDSMSTGIAVMESTYDSKTKTFTGIMDEIDPMTGKKMKVRDVVRLVSNDHQIQEMFSTPEGGGKETKSMEIQYQRVKK